jgi:hypothetical protein
MAPGKRVLVEMQAIANGIGPLNILVFNYCALTFFTLNDYDYYYYYYHSLPGVRGPCRAQGRRFGRGHVPGVELLAGAAAARGGQNSRAHVACSALGDELGRRSGGLGLRGA